MCFPQRYLPVRSSRIRKYAAITRNRTARRDPQRRRSPNFVLDDHLKVKTLYAELQKADDQHGRAVCTRKIVRKLPSTTVAEEFGEEKAAETIVRDVFDIFKLVFCIRCKRRWMGKAKRLRQSPVRITRRPKAALQELDGKPLKEKGVREKIDIMMKDLFGAHGERRVKLEELGDEKLLVAGHDFQQAKLLIPDVAPSNLAHSDQEADLAERDSHFKTPLAAVVGFHRQTEGNPRHSRPVGVCQREQGTRPKSGKEAAGRRRKDIPYNLRPGREGPRRAG
ncbi:hypothetical protein BV898_13997 [Hypsibius exemplaris]|uniref:Uncharacterized protein n=1 Tax=Hypsibius exemplaris TaxID=2072580 RepID=A0A1W0W946_HYPEX|nr:hypothetical protein BV898_13997 [Hypsibius exemplaris]